jgi:hypothetical protein
MLEIKAAQSHKTEIMETSLKSQTSDWSWDQGSGMTFKKSEQK